MLQLIYVDCLRFWDLYHWNCAHDARDSFPWSECVCLPVLVPCFGLELSLVTHDAKAAALRLDNVWQRGSRTAHTTGSCPYNHPMVVESFRPMYVSDLLSGCH
jgi:hypothetical protein